MTKWFVYILLASVCLLLSCGGKSVREKFAEADRLVNENNLDSAAWLLEEQITLSAYFVKAIYMGDSRKGIGTKTCFVPSAIYVCWKNDTGARDPGILCYALDQSRGIGFCPEVYREEYVRLGT